MTYRADQPPPPARMAKRPIERGYAVPWFVAKIGDHYDFRVIDDGKIEEAITYRLCWLCGQRMGGFKAFCIGPMCVINRVISEPPSHRECCEWAMRACPFLTQREHKRREAGLPTEGIKESAGFGIKRQPGVAVLWVTKSFKVARVTDGVLFDLGDPVEIRWYREGRAATRDEVLQSIESGYPILLEAAEQDGPRAIKALESARERALRLLPAETSK